MGLRHLLRSMGPAALVCTAWMVMTSDASAQLFTPNAGVMVDGKGVLSTVTVPDPTGEQMPSASRPLRPSCSRRWPRRALSQDFAQSAGKVLAKHIANGRKPTDEMRFLAGLTRVQNIFLYPETGDIVIAGPAEGWVHRPGRPRDRHEHRPAGGRAGRSGRGDPAPFRPADRPSE